MRLAKYYDTIKTNRPFFKAPLKQKYKITLNVVRFLKNNLKKPLTINNSPITAQIEPTSLCNLKCKMCIREKENVPLGEMSFENFKKIMENLGPLYKVGIAGQGELFLNKDIFKMIDYATKKGSLVHIVSNGTLLTKEIINKICESEIGEIDISLDSVHKKKYEKIRVGANFDEVCENIKNLASELKKKKKGTIVAISTVVFKDNMEEIPEFVKLAKELGVNKIAFQTLQAKENYFKAYDKEMKGQIVRGNEEELRKKIEEAKKIAKEKGMRLIFDEIKSPGCLWPWRGIYVNWKGDVTVCCKVIDYKNPKLGNLLEEDFWKIWNSRNYQIFRQQIRQKKVPFDCCKGCNMI
jgi:radical SAM protein with 4Fe4S-binding SPASM domain